MSTRQLESRSCGSGVSTGAKQMTALCWPRRFDDPSLLRGGARGRRPVW